MARWVGRTWQGLEIRVHCILSSPSGSANICLSNICFSISMWIAFLPCEVPNSYPQHPLLSLAEDGIWVRVSAISLAGSVVKKKNLPANAGKISWKRKWQPAPVFLPGESHGQSSLAGFSPRGRKELDMTELAWSSSSAILVSHSVFLGLSTYTGYSNSICFSSVSPASY